MSGAAGLVQHCTDDSGQFLTPSLPPLPSTVICIRFCIVFHLAAVNARMTASATPYAHSDWIRAGQGLRVHFQEFTELTQV